MIRATWNGAVIAESDRTTIVEGNHYFPIEDVRTDLLVPSDRHTTCFWKGTASYYSVAVDGSVNQDAAWFYPDPSDAAREIVDHIAFWRGVEVQAVPASAADDPGR